MIHHKSLLLSFILLLFVNVIYAQDQPIKYDGFAIGADLSMTKAIIDKGGIYYVDNQVADVFAAFKVRGYDYARIRIFHNPNGEEGTVNSLEYTLQLAQQIKDAGLKLLLDFHYSDWWADPSQQTKPAAWTNLDFITLNDSIYNYTMMVMNKLASQGISPDMVQTGNEIHHGMLWPDGEIWINGQSNWTKFTTLLKSAIRGVMDSNEGFNIPIMVHGISSSNTQESQAYIDSLLVYNVDFDIIGMSYYLCWDGTPDLLDENLAFINTNYDKDIILVETNYRADGDLPEWCMVETEDQPFPLSEEGQYNYIQSIYNTLIKYSNAKGLFYWGGELIWADDIGGSYSSLFHWEGHALKGFDAFKDLNLSTPNFIPSPIFELELNQNKKLRINSKENITEDLQLVVINMEGKTLYNQYLEDKFTTIDLSEIKMGIYIIYIKTNRRILHTEKILINY